MIEIMKMNESYITPTADVYELQPSSVLCESFGREPGPGWDVNNATNINFTSNE